MAIDALIAEKILSGTLGAATNELAKAFKETFSKVPGSGSSRDSAIRQMDLMGGFFGVLAGSADASDQQERFETVSESLKMIATRLRETFSSGEPGESASTAGKPSSEGVPPGRGRRKGAGSAAPKPPAKQKASRSARGVRNKGGGRKS